MGWVGLRPVCVCASLPMAAPPRMPSNYLTKSDFKAAFDCRTKLYYRKHGYPSALQEDEYMQFLADGGFMVEHVAKATYPQGVDLAGLRDPEKAFARTQELIAVGDCTLFEAAAMAGKFYVRMDILRRSGRVLELIEVKSSSVGPNPPIKTTMSARPSARWIASVSRSRSSPITCLVKTSTPNRFRFCVMMSEFVSTRCGVRSSLPIAIISASFGVTAEECVDMMGFELTSLIL